MTALLAILTVGILLDLVGTAVILSRVLADRHGKEQDRETEIPAENGEKKPDLIDEGIRNILSFSANGNDGFGGRGEQDDR